MGEIYGRFAETFRDYKVPGLPASGANEPIKRDIRNIALPIEAGIAAAALSGTDLAAAAVLLTPLVETAQSARNAAEASNDAAGLALDAAIAARDAANDAEHDLEVAIAAIPTSVAGQLGAAVATATSAAVTAGQTATAKAIEASQYAAMAAALANRFTTYAAGDAATATGQDFTVVDGAGGWINVYRKGTSTENAPLIQLPGKAGYASVTGAGLIGWHQEGSDAGAAADNVQRKLEESVSVKDYGAIGGNVVKDTDAFLKAVDLARARVLENGTGIDVRLPWLGGSDLVLDPAAIQDAFAFAYNGAFPITITGAHFGTRIRPASACDYLFHLGGTMVTFERVTVTDPAGFIGGAAWYGHADPTDYPTVLDNTFFGAGNGSQAFLYENDGPYRYDLINPRGQNIGGILRNRKAGVQGRIINGMYLSGGTYRGLLMDGGTNPDSQAEGFRCDGGVLIMNGASNTVGVEVLMALDYDIQCDVNQLGPGGVGLRVAPPAGKSANLCRFDGFFEGGAGGRAVELIGTSGNISDCTLDVRLGNGSSTGVGGIYARSVQRLDIVGKTFYLDGRALDVADCAEVTIEAASDLRGGVGNLVAGDVSGEFASRFGLPVQRFPAMAYSETWTGYSAAVAPGAGAFGSVQQLYARYQIRGGTMFWEQAHRIVDAGTATGAFNYSLPRPVNTGSSVITGHDDGYNGDALRGQANDANVAILNAASQSKPIIVSGAVIRTGGFAQLQ